MNIPFNLIIGSLKFPVQIPETLDKHRMGVIFHNMWKQIRKTNYK